jgi:putative sigma-54 modulation protein
MKIDYIARKVNLEPQVRELAAKKLDKIKKYFNDILDVRVEVGQERHLYVADLSVKGKDFNIQATSQHKDITTAIQDAIDKLEIQARRAKTRLKDHKGRQGRAAAPDWPAAEPAEEAEVIGGSDRPRIVERRRIPVKPMSLEEAVMQLEESSDDFLVFRNSGNDTVNVLYRRSDRNMGLITPEL